MTIRRVLDRLLVVRNDQGLAASIQVHEFDGDRYLRTLPPADILLDDPEFRAIAGELGMQAIGERDALQAQLTASQTELAKRDSDLQAAKNELTAKAEKIEELRDELKEARISVKNEIESLTASVTKKTGEIDILTQERDRLLRKSQLLQSEVESHKQRGEQSAAEAAALSAEIERLGATVITADRASEIG
jgi:chromosome segregation ATPase